MSTTDQICPDCGAPLHPENSVQLADSLMHAELAQANVLRLRGDRDGAEKKCLSILKRYPNEPEAHSLLGELSADREEYGRAIEWLELALDLNPNSATDRARLEELKTKVQQAEVAHTEESLGLPPQINYVPWIIGFVTVILAMVLFAAMHAPKSPTSPVAGGTVEAPRQTDAPAVTGGTTAPTAKTASETGSKESAVGVGAYSLEDRTILEQLQKGAYGGSVLAVQQDPRDKSLVVTYATPKPEEARHVGAALAKDALDRNLETLLVTVRGLSGDQLVFEADGSRPKLAELEADTSQDLTAGNDSWIANFLQREWPSPSTVTQGTSTGSSGGGAAPIPTTSTASTPEPYLGTATH